MCFGPFFEIGLKLKYPCPVQKKKMLLVVCLVWVCLSLLRCSVFVKARWDENPKVWQVLNHVTTPLSTPLIDSKGILKILIIICVELIIVLFLFVNSDYKVKKYNLFFKDSRIKLYYSRTPSLAAKNCIHKKYIE